jgi:hypothetical protein
VALPEIPRCDEIKNEDPKYLNTVWYKITPESWLESGSLLVAFSGEWRTIKAEMIGCEQNITVAFNAQRRASVAKIEEPIGHEGPDAPVFERLTKYEAQLAALVKRRESQLEGVDRAEFQNKEKDWREELEKESAEIKSAQARLGFRTRST